MKRLKCFLCGARYSPENREKVAMIYGGTYGGDMVPPNDKILKPSEPFEVSYIRINKHILRLCPACIRAAALGMVLTELGDPNGSRWGEPIELEDELSEEDLREENDE
jgi:hypothetical protein